LGHTEAPAITFATTTIIVSIVTNTAIVITIKSTRTIATSKMVVVAATDELERSSEAAANSSASLFAPPASLAAQPVAAAAAAAAAAASAEDEDEGEEEEEEEGEALSSAASAPRAPGNSNVDVDVDVDPINGIVDGDGDGDGDADVDALPPSMVVGGSSSSTLGRRRRGSAVTAFKVSAQVSSKDEFLLRLHSPAKAKDEDWHCLEEALSEELPGLDCEQLFEEEQVCLPARHYPLVARAFQQLQTRSPLGLAVIWIPLPGWLTAALPSFSEPTDDEASKLATESAPWLPEGLMAYQRAAVDRAVSQRGRILLADEMGLGKTAQALSIVAQYLEDEGPALIVVPPSLPSVWREEALRWIPGLKKDDVQVNASIHDRPVAGKKIVIMSYVTFCRKPKVYDQTATGEPWQIIVCDEAHALRNPTSQRTKVLLPMVQRASRAILVTGTPTPKQGAEAYTLLHALRPLQCTLKEWQSRYSSVRRDSGDLNGEDREVEIGCLLAEVMVRRAKSEVLSQLPEKRRQRIAIELPQAARTKLQSLQQARDEQHFEVLASLKEAAALDYVQYLLDGSSGKFLLFAHHLSMLNCLQRLLEKNRVDYIRIDGATPVSVRPSLVERFQTQPSCRVGVLSILAAGEGLTLTAASVCVFCELCPAVPGVIEQAEARIHRLGQKAAQVDVHYLVVEGTRDGVVFQRLEKRSLAVLRAVSGGNDVDSSSRPPATTTTAAAPTRSAASDIPYIPAAAAATAAAAAAAASAPPFAAAAAYPPSSYVAPAAATAAAAPAQQKQAARGGVAEAGFESSSLPPPRKRLRRIGLESAISNAIESATGGDTFEGTTGPSKGAQAATTTKTTTTTAAATTTRKRAPKRAAAGQTSSQPQPAAAAKRAATKPRASRATPNRAGAGSCPGQTALEEEDSELAMLHFLAGTL